MSTTPEEREAKQRSDAIDRRLRSDAKEYENTIKILLLGKTELYKTPTSAYTCDYNCSPFWKVYCQPFCVQRSLCILH